MVLSGGILFVAGPPDVVDEKEIWGKYHMSWYQGKIKEQVEALSGDQGALLLAVSSTTGERLSEYRLDALPVFDGMAAAGGRLFMSMKDGSVLCLGE
jgi:hypothetical protein